MSRVARPTTSPPEEKNSQQSEHCECSDESKDGAATPVRYREDPARQQRREPAGPKKYPLEICSSYFLIRLHSNCSEESNAGRNTEDQIFRGRVFCHSGNGGYGAETLLRRNDLRNKRYRFVPSLRAGDLRGRARRN